MRRAMGCGVVAVAVVLGVSPARAQDAPATVAAADASPATPRSAPELSGGFEGDAGMTYGYVSAAMAFGVAGRNGWGLRASVSHLRYDFDDDFGRTSVDSPGLFAGAFYRRADATTYVALGGGYEARRERRTEPGASAERETRHGPALQAFGLYQPHGRLYATAFAGYGWSDGYTWSRLALLQQLSNLRGRHRRSWHAGLEVTGHGNADVVGYGAGVVFELAESPDRFGSLRLSAGYGRRDYDVGRDEDRVYFGLSVYRNLRPRPLS